MIKYLLLLFAGFTAMLSVQAQPEILEQLQERYALPNGFSATITLHLEVPGIQAPDKTIEVKSENGKAPKIKGYLI